MYIAQGVVSCLPVSPANSCFFLSPLLSLPALIFLLFLFILLFSLFAIPDFFIFSAILVPDAFFAVSAFSIFLFFFMIFPDFPVFININYHRYHLPCCSCFPCPPGIPISLPSMQFLLPLLFAPYFNHPRLTRYNFQDPCTSLCLSGSHDWLVFLRLTCDSTRICLRLDDSLRTQLFSSSYSHTTNTRGKSTLYFPEVMRRCIFT